MTTNEKSQLNREVFIVFLDNSTVNGNWCKVIPYKKNSIGSNWNKIPIRIPIGIPIGIPIEIPIEYPINRNPKIPS